MIYIHISSGNIIETKKELSNCEDKFVEISNMTNELWLKSLINSGKSISEEANAFNKLMMTPFLKRIFCWHKSIIKACDKTDKKMREQLREDFSKALSQINFDYKLL